MNKARIKFFAGVLLACGILILFPAQMLGLFLFAGSLLLLIMAYSYFDHALFFKEWRTATTGKRRASPGEAVAMGAVFLLVAAGLIYLGIRLILWRFR